MFKNSIIMICLGFIVFSAAAQERATLAVIDLKNNGGVSDEDISLVCDAIDRQVSLDNRYTPFDRLQTARMLGQNYSFNDKDCFDKQCLADLGRTLGVQKAIGGTISRQNRTVTIALNLIDVQTGKAESKITLQKESSRDNLLAIHIPSAVTKLLSDAPVEKRRIRQSRNHLWITLAGILAIGGAGLGIALAAQ